MRHNLILSNFFFFTLPRKIRLSSYIEAQRTCWHPAGEDWAMPSLTLPVRVVFRPHGPWDTVLCSVQGAGYSDKSGSRLRQLCFSSSTCPIALHTGVLSVFVEHRKETLISLSSISPIFMWKLENPFSVPSSQRKAEDCPWLVVVPPFCGSPGEKPVSFSYFILSPIL